MSVSKLLRSWLGGTKPRRQRQARRRPRPFVELLEARTLLDIGLGGNIDKPDEEPPVVDPAPEEPVVEEPPATEDPGTAPPPPVGSEPGAPAPEPDLPPLPPDQIDFSPFLTRLYHDFLGRNPDAGGILYWNTALNHGLTREQVVAGFVNSPEYRIDQLRESYQMILGRDVDSGAVPYWLGLMNRGLSETQIQGALLASPEAFQQQASIPRQLAPEPTPFTGTKLAPRPLMADATQNWLFGLYGITLGREPDAAGLRFWNGLIQSGMPRETVATAFLKSPDSLAWSVKESYQSFLDRAPDTGGLAWWGTALAGGLTADQFALFVASSEEYFTESYRGNDQTPVSDPGVLAASDEDVSAASGLAAAGAIAVEGTGEGQVPFMVYLNRVPVMRGVVGTDGTWSVHIPSSLPFGQHTLEVRPFGTSDDDTSATGAGPSTGTGGSGGGSTGGGGSSGGTFNFTVGGGGRPAPRQSQFPNVNASNFPASNITEVAIAVNPVNPLQVFAVGIAIDLSAGQLIAFSTDGGQTFTSRLAADGTDGLVSGRSDPACVFDEFGNLFWAYLADLTNGDAVLNMSTDGGQTFTLVNRFSATSGGFMDQEAVAAGAGSVWVMFTDTGAGTDPVRASGAPVTGLGQVGTFNAIQPALGSGPGNFNDIAIGPNGEVMVTYQGNLSSTGEGTDTLFANVDPDGLGPAGFGQAIPVTQTNVGGIDAIPAQPGPFNVGGRTVDAEPGLAWDRTGGPHNGRVYFVYADENPDESDDHDILVRFSDDNGSTWSSPVRVNDDATTNSQFLPRIAIDQTTGIVAVSWYDCRNDTGSGPDDQDGRPNTDAIYFAAVSMDGGNSFLPNLQIASGPSNSVTLNPNGFFNFGDYTGLAFANGVFYPCWSDNSTTLPGGNPPLFSMATAAVPVVPPPPAVISDVFELNDRSDTATNLGVIQPGLIRSPVLSIFNHPFPLGGQDFDWFKFKPSGPGLLTAGILNSNGLLEIHLYRLLANNTVVEVVKNTIAGLENKSVTLAVSGSETFFFQVKGIPLALGVAGVSGYELFVNLG